MRSTIFGNGISQNMVFPLDYPDVSLRGEPKGLRIVLSERGLWRA
ncbi:3373_t:CDS:2, partial [Ambispora gerdemannii]